jgi:hypothetical protein
MLILPKKVGIHEVGIVEIEKAELKEPLVILGFAGTGRERRCGYPFP